MNVRIKKWLTAENIQLLFYMPSFRFVCIGIINTLFGYSIYALALWFGLKVLFALIISTVVGVLFNFKTIGVLVFGSKNNSLLLKFSLVYVVIFFANLGFIKLLVMNGLGDYFSGFVAMVPMAGMSFFLNKYFVFNG